MGKSAKRQFLKLTRSFVKDLLKLARANTDDKELRKELKDLRMRLKDSKELPTQMQAKELIAVGFQAARSLSDDLDPDAIGELAGLAGVPDLEALAELGSGKKKKRPVKN